MTVNNASREIREWLRSRGEEPSRRGALSRRHMELWYQAHPGDRPAGDVRLLPSPGMDDPEIDLWEDLGDLVPDGPESDGEAPGGGGVDESTPGPPGAPTADAPPRHGTREWRRGTAKKPGSRPVRVTAGIRSDIDAKISFALEIPGRVWQARDPVCGGTFVEQRPAIADALTEIVCQSPDLIAWFTGAGGQFMLWLNLAAACWPVATIVMAHHVYHTIEGQQEDMQQPDYGRYAA